jgi:hypothetical protein
MGATLTEVEVAETEESSPLQTLFPSSQSDEGTALVKGEIFRLRTASSVLAGGGGGERVEEAREAKGGI